MTKLRVLSLFAGIGGFDLGLERTGGFRTVAFCEIEPFCQKVLAKHWPGVPCFEDVRTLKGEDVGAVDVICGGYPCQPFSTAGQRRGAEDDRHLWPEFMRLVAELRPSWVIGENVAGHISMGLDDVLSDLERQGYACRSFVIPACAVGAQHKRDRVWTVAHAADVRRREKQNEESSGKPGKQVEARRGEQFGGMCLAQRPGPVADADEPGSQRYGRLRERPGERASRPERRSEPGAWIPEPGVGRVANGVPARVDRLKALGNAVVPQIPELIGRAILQAEAAA